VTMAPLPSYAIVLSTYNGNAFLAEQIESIRAQTAPDFRLYIRDDGSADGTLDLIARFAAIDPRIAVLSDGAGNVGAPASFGLLLSHAFARREAYVFLSDQDDVWLPHKAARMLGTATHHARWDGADLPLLVHSDLRVVTSDLGEIHPSFFSYQQLDPIEDTRPTRLLFRNAVTGCATLVNRALLEAALPFPRVAMHDWWLAQCAAFFGRIVFVDEATVLYRQHGANAFGARGLLGTVIQVLGAPRRSARYFLRALDHLWELRRRGETAEPPPPAALQYLLDDLHKALTSDRTTASQRLRAIWRSGAHPTGIAAQALLAVRIALLPWLRARYGPPPRRRDGELPQVV
jgi:glycosyltransferase involved in cell wall biosynthesis